MTGRWAGWLAACRAVTATWQACRYLIDLSGKQLVHNKLQNQKHMAFIWITCKRITQFVKYMHVFKSTFFVYCKFDRMQFFVKCDNTVDLARWPSPSCKFPDWLDGVTWRDLSGQYRLTSDGDVLTSSMTSRSRGRRRGRAVMAEYRCLALWSTMDTAAATEQIIIFSLVHHNWSVLGFFPLVRLLCNVM